MYCPSAHLVVLACVGVGAAFHQSRIQLDVRPAFSILKPRVSVAPVTDGQDELAPEALHIHMAPELC